MKCPESGVYKIILKILQRPENILHGPGSSVFGAAVDKL